MIDWIASSFVMTSNANLVRKNKEASTVNPRVQRVKFTPKNVARSYRVFELRDGVDSQELAKEYLRTSTGLYM